MTQKRGQNNNIKGKFFLDGQDRGEFPVGVVPAPVGPRHPIAAPHWIPLFSRPIAALPSPSDGRVGQGHSRDARRGGTRLSMNRARGRADADGIRADARKGAAGEERRGEERRGLPIPTNSTDDNEGENKNKAVRQLNERAYARSEAGQRAGQRVS